MTIDTASKWALVIDDDDDIRDLLQMLLEIEGFEVETMRDGIDAIALKRCYDVIVLDMKMPVFDGERLTDYWKLTAPEILSRVILLSAYPQRPVDRDLGTFAWLAKPFDCADVVAAVKACLLQGREAKEASGENEKPSDESERR